MKSLLIIFLSFASVLPVIGLDGYKIETIQTPPGVRFHVTGLDIGKDGTVYCATRYGEVWILKNNKWSRFAEGLHEPCGLLVEENGIIVAQKPELTKLIDTNNDGVADEYINLNSAWQFHNNYHEFNFGVLKDNDNNYIGSLNLAHNDPGAFQLSIMGTNGGYRGWAYKVTPEGKFVPFANGLRSPAGLGKNPQGDIFYTDNQGDYVGTSMLCELKQNHFYGHPISLVDTGKSRAEVKAMSIKQLDEMRTLPVAWIPHIEMAQSPGNPEWDSTQGKFGPFKDQFFIGDQSRSNVFRVSLQKVGDIHQGCVINFMEGFQSGCIRLKFAPDGSLWVGQTGRGWTSRGGKIDGLQKVIWDGTVPFEIQDVKITTEGFKVTFTQPIENFDEKQLNISNWWYVYSNAYGSPKANFTNVKIEQVIQSSDKKEILIKLPLVEKKVYCIDLSGVTNSNGKKLTNAQAYYTLVKTLK